MMDNTVGSLSTSFCNFPNTLEDYYILGLWCADGYHRTSSVGLTNVDRDLIATFRNFFEKLFLKERIKLDIYKEGKRKQWGYKLYVNSRPLLRIFKSFKENNSRDLNNSESIGAYFAGRFDGDGCISKNLKEDCRISYGNFMDAKLDYDMLLKTGLINSKLYWYRTSHTHVIYISTKDVEKFRDLIGTYSKKLQKLVLSPVETLTI